jgi:Fic family protein
MFEFEDLELSHETNELVESYLAEVDAFRQEGPLEEVSLEKLREDFKAAHIYHSAGIEGNTLTLQETLVVLSEGIDISGKPIKESIEVRNLGRAFDYLQELSATSSEIRETDIRSLHKLIIGDDSTYLPGEYRRTGVTIAGADIIPPEPISVPGLMAELVEWLNVNRDRNALVLATLAHHRLTAIHPFADGNGRVSRLVMNLLLLKRGVPIANVQREERARYYEALSFADVGLFDDLVQLIANDSRRLFLTYLRLRKESKRMEEWASRWGTTHAEHLRRRESREFELWQSRMRQVILTIKAAAELLEERMERVRIRVKDDYTPIDFEKYQQLQSRGYAEHTYALQLTFAVSATGATHKYMFRFARNSNKFSRSARFIPLELNYWIEGEQRYVRLSDLPSQHPVRLREIYFSDGGDVAARIYNFGNRRDAEETGKAITDYTQMFFDDVLKNVLNIR